MTAAKTHDYNYENDPSMNAKVRQTAKERGMSIEEAKLLVQGKLPPSP